MTHSDHPATDYEAVLGDDGQLLDVRQPDELAAGALPAAVNIPLGELAERVDELDPDRRVVVVCRSGGRSTKASEFLTETGFSDVVNLAGGMLAFEA
jgi:rhodanese-related sulfurtransferase